MIEMYLLEQLNAFYKYGTLSVAAEHLHLSQPSLSRSMQKLEAELGVTLFERQKNRIFLNDTGKLAAEHAVRILHSEAEMKRQVRAFDRSLNTFSIGSCAPGPLIKALPSVTGAFTELTVSSKIETEDALLKGLRESVYQLVILSKPTYSDEFHCQEYVTEQLYLSINNFHPAATYSSVRFDQMDDQNFIMYAHVGVWEDIVRTKMTRAKFYKQEDIEAVGELANNSDLPSFSTNITLEELPSRKNVRINIPFSDEEATITFYIVCTKENFKRFRNFLKSVEVI